jgi:hypothetical protein
VVKEKRGMEKRVKEVSQALHPPRTCLPDLVIRPCSVKTLKELSRTWALKSSIQEIKFSSFSG